MAEAVLVLRGEGATIHGKANRRAGEHQGACGKLTVLIFVKERGWGGVQGGLGKLVMGWLHRAVAQSRLAKRRWHAAARGRAMGRGRRVPRHGRVLGEVRQACRRRCDGDSTVTDRRKVCDAWRKA